MAMMISKFHRLIQSRLLWAAFLVVIIFSFVVWGTQVTGRSGRSGEPRVLGRLDGKPVPAEEFRNAWHNVYLGLLLRLGRMPPRTEQMDRLVSEMAWKRIVSLREASRLGLETADAELLAFIQQTPAFQTDGKFDKNRFNAFVKGPLAEMGYPEAFFAEHLREELTLEKLRRLLDATAVAPPEDVDAMLRRLTDEFTVAYFVIPRAAAADRVSVGDEDAKAQYTADPVRYALPEKVRVRAAFFPTRQFSLADEVIPEAELEDYYTTHLNEFRVPAPTLPPEPGQENAGPRLVTAPFEVVRADIEKKLREQSARRRAREAADDFWRRTSPDIADAPVPFDEAARQANIRVLDFEPFAMNEETAGFPAGSALHRAAFGLSAEEGGIPVSDPISVEQGFYVLSLAERIPSRIPEFEEVAAKAMADARDRRIAEEVERLAAEAADQARSGQPLSEIAAALGVELKTTPTFNAMDGLKDLEFGPALIRAAIGANVGETPDPVPLPEDRRLVLQVVSRTAGAADRVASLRPFVESDLRAERSRLAFESWQEYLLRRARFEDLTRRETDENGAG